MQSVEYTLHSSTQVNDETEGHCEERNLTGSTDGTKFENWMLIYYVEAGVFGENSSQFQSRYATV